MIYKKILVNIKCYKINEPFIFGWHLLPVGNEWWYTYI